ncbi:MAG: hypothetical protein M3Y13_12650, partial [Armatimonadota bacterium]|nr:hypothetical protein [Armatimonadota bacterium]
MPWAIERLRAAIVALAVLLLATIAGAFFYGRWRVRHITQDLPARLGLQIQQSTKGFSLSQSNGRGRTLFTLHAARAVEFKSGGRVALHDVKIELYSSRQDGKRDSTQNGTADTIAGSDFEYDPHSQVVRSDGEAHIVLHAPATGNMAGQVVRLTTHGLIFNQKTGVAACSGEVDFQLADSSGQAVGAQYDSKQGRLLLASNIVLTTQMESGPKVLHASRAMYDRNQQQIHLSQPRYSSGVQRAMADAATVLLRADGSAERVDARGGVRLVSTASGEVRAANMQISLDTRRQPRQAHFSGGVEFTDNQSVEKVSGNAREAEVEFDSEGRADRVVLDRAVECRQEAGAGKNLLRRTLSSDRLVLNLLPSKTGNAQLKSAEATGDAVFSSLSTMAGRAPQQTTLAGQSLNAIFAAANELHEIDGTGQTRLKTVAANGDIDSSTGDTLQIEFAPGQAPRRAPTSISRTNVLAAQGIRTAVQTGHVTLQQMAYKKAAESSGPQISTAIAARASYVAADDTLTLTGNPVFRDAQLEMTASRMAIERTTGKMVAIGPVQTTLRSGQGSTNQSRSGAGGLLDGRQPVHIIAERADLVHDTQTAVFSGRARLWQGDDTIEAPVIELAQKTGTLTAYGPSCAQCVISNFVGAIAVSSQPARQKHGAETGPSTFRLVSERLLYSDAERKASFLHHVQVSSSSGLLTADDAEVFLAPGDRRNLSDARGNMAQSSVERIVATGDVRLLQPGRSATGGRLVYTAADGHFVLTGDAEKPPTVVDADRGTVTGQVLTFA